ncbi:NADPH:quinone reductase [Spelaeicoccus albus]|uniref:2-desacetyl-2-hydroxyethyl bacteriochlorophyllide A dehydrogenase n=1 Tax=Spelaeicoccus albus TaxID=1280376 RepID=A0A7Z0AAR6_9MICO|nr:NADPH:quinone reductase [Spelaeicoccus albus]NYI66208.1 2-desacetyl-2-hydroxyethyl bacteriochlorophyllide A dehydrogenase [Spelaeicoccus albus]
MSTIDQDMKSIPDTMRAAFIEGNGPADAIEVGRLPVPTPGPTDLLVKMEASEVNHVDLFVRSGAYQTSTPFPFVIGRDLVGTVAAAGPGAAHVRIGDRVWCNSLGHDGRQGAFAEYSIVPVDRAYRLPEGVEPATAAVILHAAATAHVGLSREAGLRAGETIVVHHAGGAVGSAVVQMAAARGARVVATCAPRDEEWCAACGADATIDYERADFSDRVRATAPRGVDVWWDTSGRNDLRSTVPLLAMGGRVIAMSGLQGADPVVPIGDLYTKDASLRGFAISNASISDLADAAKAINRMLAAGRLPARVGATYHLADAARAHEDLQNGAVYGRILVLP